MLTTSQLRAIALISQATADRFVGPLNAAMDKFGINSPLRQAGFIAQCLHESQNLTAMVECLAYRPAALMSLFRGRFTSQQAGEYGFVPGGQRADEQAIANIAYANKNGNGGIASGDGWKFRGRGPIQITGRSNYAECGIALGLDLLNHPELLETPEHGCMAAAWFWHKHNLNRLADALDYTGISRAINGGDNGLAERLALTLDAAKVLDPNKEAA